MENLNRLVIISYATIQVSISLFISIVGAIHVNRCMDEETKCIEIDQGITLNTKIEEQEKVDAVDADTNKKNAKSEKKGKGFCELWLKTMWKMRNVYSGLAVHSFDVLTDILVIIQWLQYTNEEGDNIDPEIMAYSAIAVLIASRVISTFAIFMKEGNVRRAILQFFDFLIFEEIYESHKKIVSQIKNKKSIQQQHTAIESTISFKYVRNFEAVFESIPQSVLQLVFIMRIPPSKDKYNPIFIISIIQSVVSMTNSILNNDYTQMQEDKWKEYKQRFPPTFKCFKHALSRFSEVVYRIGLLSLFWTVCGGEPFSIMLGVDLILIIARMVFLISMKEIPLSGDTLLLNLNSLIVIPSEEVYYSDPLDWRWFFYKGCSNGCAECLAIVTVNIFCCCGCAAFLASLTTICYGCSAQVDSYYVPTSRIGVSIIELLFLIIYGLYGDNGENKIFLLSADHGLSIFIATCVFFFIYSQYLLLFPNFSLPLNVNVRSKWGYAFSNELNELKKIKIRTTQKPKRIYQLNEDGKTGVEHKSYDIQNAQQFWDEPFRYTYQGLQAITAAVYAIAKENNDIVEWLEEQGANSHEGMDVKTAKELLTGKTTVVKDLLNKK